MQHNEVSGLYRSSTHAHRTDIDGTDGIAGSGLNLKTYFALIESWCPIERKEEGKREHVLSPSSIFPAFPLLESSKDLCTAIERIH